MNDTDVYSQPAEVVKRFIADMHDWELRTASLHRAATPDQYAETWSASNRSLAEVFACWCTPKERKYGRLGSFQSPPEYQPNAEDVLETVLESPRRACVYTLRRTTFGGKFRYALLKHFDRWLIDNVKCRSDDEDQWSVGTL